jgi:predicted nucleic acid-binding protein
VAGFLDFVRDGALILAEGNASPILVRDHLDQKFLDAALTGRADFLVTGDNDLLVHAGDPRLGALRIVAARAFLEAIGST